MSYEDDQTNILFLFPDQHRFDWLGMNPDVAVETPNIDRMAEQGVQFTNAICPSPVCNPTRASIASGFEYDRCGVPANRFDYPLDIPTVYQRLRDQAGYHVMGCGKFDLTGDYNLGLSGSEDIHRWGFSDAIFNPALNNTVRRILEDINREPRDPYTSYLDKQGLLETHIDDYQKRSGVGMLSSEHPNLGFWTATFPTPIPDEAYYDNWITRQGLRLLENSPRDRPWFLEVDFQNPHHPWDITEDMHKWYRDPPVEFPEPTRCDLDVSSEKHQEVRRNYSAEVEHLDRCVGRFIDKLEEMDEFENTIIVYAGDHGEMLGDLGQWQKLSPLQASVGVPLVFSGPGIANSNQVDDPVTTLDLHATFLDIAGITPPASIDSRSMLSYLKGNTDHHRDFVYSGLSSWRLVYDGRYKLIKGYDPALRHESVYEPMYAARENMKRRQKEREVILYDVEQDEYTNRRDRHPEVVERLTRYLNGVLA